MTGELLARITVADKASICQLCGRMIFREDRLLHLTLRSSVKKGEKDIYLHEKCAAAVQAFIQDEPIEESLRRAAGGAQ